MHVELIPINAENRAVCVTMRVQPGQERFVAQNARSLEEAAKAEYAAIARPFAIAADGKPVGFAMFAVDAHNDDPHDRYWIWRLMIDGREQGKGYGAAALECAVEYLRGCGADEITLSTEPDNIGALALYHKAGFAENGQVNGEEIVLKRFL